jgi:UDP-N-acetylglucosamine 3-dehydrogenase
MNKIRIGVIGVGIIWRRVHKPSLTRLSSMFEISAFCATSEKSKNSIKAEYPDIPFYKDYRELVKEPAIDAVIIMTPIPLNQTIAMAALSAGKDVFTEKPMATNIKDAKELIKKEKDTGRRVIVLEQFAYNTFSDEMVKIVDSGRLGEILMFDRLFHGYIGINKNVTDDYGNTLWRINPEYPLGMLLDGGIHEIAMLSKIFGKPLSVFAEGVNYRKDYGDYDYQSIIMKYQRNLIGTFGISFFLGGSTNYFIVRGTKGLAFHEDDSKIIIEENSGKKETIAIKEEDPYFRMWDVLSRCIEKNVKPYYTTEKALDDLQILEAVKKSLKDGIKVSVK